MRPILSFSLLLFFTFAPVPITAPWPSGRHKRNPNDWKSALWNQFVPPQNGGSPMGWVSGFIPGWSSPPAAPVQQVNTPAPQQAVVQPNINPLIPTSNGKRGDESVNNQEHSLQRDRRPPVETRPAKAPTWQESIGNIGQMFLAGASGKNDGASETQFDGNGQLSPQTDSDRYRLFGAGVTQLIGDISQHSDNHKKPNQGFDRVRTMMHSFFQMAASGSGQAGAQSDSSGTMSDMYHVKDGTELSANRQIARDLFESDMVLTVEQMQDIIDQFRNKRRRRRKGRRGKRKVIAGSVYRWPARPIPYVFGLNDEPWKNTIRQGLKHWEQHSCVRFQESSAEVGDHLFFMRGGGCYSSVGRTGGAQQISIGFGCEQIGIIAHEVGHSLGFWHEQSRPDRDQYLRINERYIAAGTQGNFEKRSAADIEDMGVPYDVGSVMHYGPTAFTTNPNQYTIDTVDSNYRATIGQRRGLSFIDVKQMNRLYCNHVCGNSLSCKHGGYANPNDCSGCICPDGLGGPQCDSLASSTAGCGGELTATNAWQELKDSTNGECYWRIRAGGGRIRLEITEALYICELTCSTYLEIKHNSDFQKTGFRMCCNAVGDPIVSDTDEVLIISSTLGQGGHFTLRYIIDDGAPLPPRTTTTEAPWTGLPTNGAGKGPGPGTVEIPKFILNHIPHSHDSKNPGLRFLSTLTDIFTGGAHHAHENEESDHDHHEHGKR